MIVDEIGPRGGKLEFRRHKKTKAIVSDSLDYVRLALPRGSGSLRRHCAQTIFVAICNVLVDWTLLQSIVIARHLR